MCLSLCQHAVEDALDGFLALGHDGVGRQGRPEQIGRVHCRLLQVYAHRLERLNACFVLLRSPLAMFWNAGAAVARFSVRSRDKEALQSRAHSCKLLLGAW